MPPRGIVQAMELQAEAERRKRAAVLESEGQRQAKINVAEADKQQVRAAGSSPVGPGALRPGLAWPPGPAAGRSGRRRRHQRALPSPLRAELPACLCPRLPLPQVILSSEATKEESINRAVGEAEAIFRRAEATARGINLVAQVRAPGRRCRGRGVLGVPLQPARPGDAVRLSPLLPPAQALHSSGGNDAASLRVAEQYIDVRRRLAPAVLPPGACCAACYCAACCCAAWRLLRCHLHAAAMPLHAAAVPPPAVPAVVALLRVPCFSPRMGLGPGSSPWPTALRLLVPGWDAQHPAPASTHPAQAFKQLAKQGTTILLPSHAGDPSALMAQAMSIYKGVGQQQQQQQQQQPEGSTPPAVGATRSGGGSSSGAQLTAGGSAGQGGQGAQGGEAAQLQGDMVGRIMGAGAPGAAAGRNPVFSLSKGGA
jgi:hypothetical protein